MNQEQLIIGREVICKIQGMPATTGIVIGEMSYSENGEVLLIADEKAIGMPVNVSHLTCTGNRNIESADKYRERYATKFPKAMKATS